MTGNRIEIVLVKLAAVFVVVLTLQSATGYAGYFISDQTEAVVVALAFALLIVIPLLLATVLWFFPAMLTRTNSTQSTAADPVEPTIGIFIGVTLIGLYTVVFGLIDLFYYEAVRLAEKEYLADGVYGVMSYSPDTIAGRYTNIFQVLLGVLILIGRRGLSNLLARARGRRAVD